VTPVTNVIKKKKKDVTSVVLLSPILPVPVSGITIQGPVQITLIGASMGPMITLSGKSLFELRC